MASVNAHKWVNSKLTQWMEDRHGSNNDSIMFGSDVEAVVLHVCQRIGSSSRFADVLYLYDSVESGRCRDCSGRVQLLIVWYQLVCKLVC